VQLNGATAVTYSDQAGNFYCEVGAPGCTEIGAGPAQSNATDCPSLSAMTDPLLTAGGNCNSCHTNGVGAQTTPMYLQ